MVQHLALPRFTYVRQQNVGRCLAEQGITLGCMVAVVQDLWVWLQTRALAAGGQVIGVIPKVLVTKELAHPGLTELHVVENMQQRKTKMSELADGFCGHSRWCWNIGRNL